MIKNTEPLSMTEVSAYLSEEDSELTGFIAKFVKLKAKEAKELREKLIELNMIKVKEENIVKIVDLLPEDATDLNKVFTDVTLDENETNRILDIVKQYS